MGRGLNVRTFNIVVNKITHTYAMFVVWGQLVSVRADAPVAAGHVVAPEGAVVPGLLTLVHVLTNTFRHR